MGKIKIGGMVIGAVQTNCYFVYREGSPDCIVFDAPDTGKEIVRRIEGAGFHVRALFLTHGHFDHIMGAQDVRLSAGSLANSRGEEAVKIYAPKSEEEMLSDSGYNMTASFGTPMTLRPNVWVEDGQEIEIAGIKIKVLFTPGHTPGSASYYIEEAGFVISGDTLFEESVGRTDFRGGDAAVMDRSIREKLFTLPDDTEVYPGHGASTTIGHEKKYNPFFSDDIWT